MTNYDGHQQMFHPFWEIQCDASVSSLPKHSSKSLSSVSSTSAATTENSTSNLRIPLSPSSSTEQPEEPQWQVEVNNASKTNIDERLKWRRRSFIHRQCCSNYIDCSFIILIIVFNCILSCFMQTTLAIAPKYETAYACEGKTLTIECEHGDVINLIRANYGRFSITICNDQGNTDWSVNCMSPKSLRVLHSKCAYKQSCSVLASTNMFGDPCPGTHKYLEAHYLCVSPTQTSTTTLRPGPPWLLTSQPSVWSTSTIRSPTTTYRLTNSNSNIHSSKSTSAILRTTQPPPQSAKTSSTARISTNTSPNTTAQPSVSLPSTTFSQSATSSTPSPVTFSTILPAPSNTGANRSTSIDNKTFLQTPHGSNTANNSITNIDVSSDNEMYFCVATEARHLFWNKTVIGNTNVIPCPGGASGIAKWQCGVEKLDGSSGKWEVVDEERSDEWEDSPGPFRPVWIPKTPDMTHCRSLWLMGLEMRVNQPDAPLVSIATELSQVTGNKALFGGDMLLATKIIQTMHQKMTYSIETFPDQKQREDIVYELLNGIVKTVSNLIDESKLWTDLSFENQIRVATSLLMGLEDSAFLLAETIVLERSVQRKVNNILLSVRVLETRNIAGNEIFPDSNADWQISDDRIEVPRNALIENSDGGLVRIVFVAFDRLEAILRPINHVLSPKQKKNLNGTQVAKTRIINSKVISASLGKGRHIQLSQPIRLTLKHLHSENVTNPLCVFWNYIDHAWSDDGCFVEHSNKTHTTCKCNHLTNFAILTEIGDGSYGNSSALFDDDILILIYISIAICIVFIIVALLSLKLLNGIFMKSNRTTIYKNLYMCLLTIEVLFLIGIELNNTNIMCGFTSAFLHCSFLCAISWIFFEGFQLYVMLTSDDILLESEKSSKMVCYYLLTYGLSLTIVAISLAIDPSTYTQADTCVWMETNNLFYFTFLMPVIFFIVASLIYSSMAFVVMCKKYKTSLKNKEHTRLASVRFYLRCSVIYMIIFIGVWVTGYLYMTLRLRQDDDEMNGVYNANNANIFGYLFVFLNSFQGIYVFVFHCIQNEKVRREYHKYIRQQTWLPKCLQCTKANRNTSASPSSNQHQATLPAGSRIAVGGGMLGTNTLQINSSNVHNSMRSINALDAQNHYHHYGPPSTSTMGRNSRPVGQTSPSSSVGSTQLIFNGSTNIPQDWNYQLSMAQDHPMPTGATLRSNYENKMKKQKDSRQFQAPEEPVEEKECFYWTEKGSRRKYNADLMGTAGGYKHDKGKTLHNAYPSYKKKVINTDQAILSPRFSKYNTKPKNASEYDYNPDDGSHAYHTANNRHLYKIDYNMMVGGGGGVRGGVGMGSQIMGGNSMYNEEPVYEEIINSRILPPGERDLGADRDGDEIIIDEDEDLIDDSYRIRTRREPNYHLDQDPTGGGFAGVGVGGGVLYNSNTHVSRSLSAMLDENNTVVCYLEPLPKN